MGNIRKKSLGKKRKQGRVQKMLGYDKGMGNGLGMDEMMTKFDQYIEPTAKSIRNIKIWLICMILAVFICEAIIVHVHIEISRLLLINLSTGIIGLLIVVSGYINKQIAEYNCNMEQALLKDIMELDIKSVPRDGKVQGIDTSHTVIKVVLKSENAEIGNLVKKAFVFGKNNKRYIVEDESGNQFLILNSDYKRVKEGKLYSIVYCKYTKLILKADEIKNGAAGWA